VQALLQGRLAEGDQEKLLPVGVDGGVGSSLGCWRQHWQCNGVSRSHAAGKKRGSGMLGFEKIVDTMKLWECLTEYLD
jgi:hypothetical protein